MRSWAKDSDGSTNGITGGALSFSFDTSKVTGGTIVHSSTYANATGGSLTNGEVSNLEGFAQQGDTTEGVTQWVRLGYVSFTASATGTASFTAAPSTDEFFYRPGEENGVPWSKVQLNSPACGITVLPQCIYDINGSGRVDGGDYTYLSEAWHSRPGDANWNSLCDFNHDQYISGADYTWMSENWHKYDTDPTLTYPVISSVENDLLTPSAVPTSSHSKALLTEEASSPEIDVELVPVAATTSSDTSPNLPTRLTQVNSIGDTFYVEVWAKDVDGSPNGITGGALSFSFDTSKVAGETHRPQQHLRQRNRRLAHQRRG